VVRVVFLAELDALLHDILAAVFQLVAQLDVYADLTLKLLFKRQGGSA
jgi:hypothetical protein